MVLVPKKEIMEEFATQCLVDGPLVVINGYFPDLKIRQVLTSLAKLILKENKSCTTRDMVAFAQQLINKPLQKRLNVCYYLCINNIDGKALRDPKSQVILSILASCPYIHVIASWDHINTMLLWDRTLLARFHWLHHEITTYDHFSTETAVEFETPTINANDDKRARGIRHVLDSLTAVHYDVLVQLAETQLSEKESCFKHGLSYSEWYEKSYQMMLVANEVKFRQLTVELLDHCAVTEHLVNNEKHYKIPYSNQIIESEIINRDIPI